MTSGNWYSMVMLHAWVFFGLSAMILVLGLLGLYRRVFYAWQLVVISFAGLTICSLILGFIILSGPSSASFTWVAWIGIFCEVLTFISACIVLASPTRMAIVST